MQWNNFHGNKQAKKCATNSILNNSVWDFDTLFKTCDYLYKNHPQKRSIDVYKTLTGITHSGSLWIQCMSVLRHWGMPHITKMIKWAIVELSIMNKAS